MFLAFFAGWVLFIPRFAFAEGKAEAFKPGEVIMEHIADAHEWHLFGHTSIPLPVILKTDKGLEIFSSSRFEHGLATYQGNYPYHLHESKIVVWDEVNAKADEENTKKILNFSITKNVTSLFISAILLLWIFISIANRYKQNTNHAPKGIQSLLEPIILFVRDEVAKPMLGKNTNKYLPYLLTVFFFIWINNMLGLLPTGANLTGNIAVTMTLAVFTFIITLFSTNKHYWGHIFNPAGVPWWLKFGIPIMPLVEFIGVFTKPFALMIRLFANITAGHLIILSIITLIFIFGQKNPIAGYGTSALAVPFALFMYFLELLVAFIQAYIFTTLTTLFISEAVGSSHDEHH